MVCIFPDHQVCKEFRTGVAFGNREQRHRSSFNRTVHLVLTDSLVADISDDIVLGRLTGKYLTYLIKRFGKKLPLLFVVADGIDVHHLTAEILRQGFTGGAVLFLTFVGGCFPLLAEGFGFCFGLFVGGFLFRSKFQLGKLE